MPHNCSGHSHGGPQKADAYTQLGRLGEFVESYIGNVFWMLDSADIITDSIMLVLGNEQDPDSPYYIFGVFALACLLGGLPGYGASWCHGILNLMNQDKDLKDKKDSPEALISNQDAKKMLDILKTNTTATVAELLKFPEFSAIAACLDKIAAADSHAEHEHKHEQGSCEAHDHYTAINDPEVHDHGHAHGHAKDPADLSRIQIAALVGDAISHSSGRAGTISGAITAGVVILSKKSLPLWGRAVLQIGATLFGGVTSSADVRSCWTNIRKYNKQVHEQKLHEESHEHSSSHSSCRPT